MVEISMPVLALCMKALEFTLYYCRALTLRSVDGASLLELGKE